MTFLLVIVKRKSWNGVENVAFIKRVAAANPFDRQPTALGGAVLLDGL